MRITILLSVAFFLRCGGRSSLEAVELRDAATLSDANDPRHANDGGDAGDVGDTSEPATMPGLLLWLRADLGTSAEGAGAVSVWFDQSGHHNDARQSSPSSRPTLSSDSSTPAVRFDGVDDYLTVGPGFDDFTSGITLFVVARTETTPQLHAPRFLDFAPTYGSLDDAIMLVRFGQGDELFFQTYAGSTIGPFTSGAATVEDGRWASYSAVAQGGVSLEEVPAAVFRNGQQRGSNVVFVPAKLTRVSNLIARSNRGDVFDSYLRADIAEIRVYQRALETDERNEIESELTARWGL